MNQFIMAALGGGIIGLAASILLLSLGRVAGISGITFSLFNPEKKDKDWRLAFVVGLLSGGGLLAVVMPSVFNVASEIPFARPTWMMGLAGLLVGFGTQMGSGCTSGHGVCGITRLSMRSLVATGTFMTVGMAIATLLVGVLS